MVENQESGAPSTGKVAPSSRSGSIKASANPDPRGYHHCFRPPDNGHQELQPLPKLLGHLHHLTRPNETTESAPQNCIVGSQNRLTDTKFHTRPQNQFRSSPTKIPTPTSSSSHLESRPSCLKAPRVQVQLQVQTLGTHPGVLKHFRQQL